MKLIKILSFTLLISVLFLNVLSCSGNEDIVGDITSPVSEFSETKVDTMTLEVKPELPITDMGGKTITIMTQSWGSYTPLDFIDIAPEEINGEILNDSAYNRSMRIEQDYNCLVAQHNVSDANEAYNVLSRTVSSGDKAFDISFMRGLNFATAIANGYLFELSELPYVNFTQPWWDYNSYESLAVINKHFVITGDISTNDMLAVWNVCFNKNMITDYSLENPYELVKSGAWTFDKAIEMSIKVAHDVNGDGIMDGNDIWGINHTNDTVIGILNSCNVKIAESDSAGIPQTTIGGEMEMTRTIDILTKLFNENYSMDTLSRDKMRSVDIDGDYFAQNQVLFLFTATHLVTALRQMDTEFGIIPYPKYDNSQENYMSSTAGIFLPLVCVPVTIADGDLENIGIFMEAFAFDGYKNVVPAFYNVILQGKFARDTESAETLEYLYNNISYDMGNIYNFNNFTSQIGALSSVMNTDFASFFAANESALQESLNTLIKNLS